MESAVGFLDGPQAKSLLVLLGGHGILELGTTLPVQAWLSFASLHGVSQLRVSGTYGDGVDESSPQSSRRLGAEFGRKACAFAGTYGWTFIPERESQRRPKRALLLAKYSVYTDGA